VRLRVTRTAGIEIEGAPFCIDSSRVQELGIITHAHTDHTARHKKTICTPETALLLGERWKRLNIRAVPYGQHVKLGDYRVTLHRAGHILGSAMVLVEHKGTRLLYTGDLRTAKSHLFAGAKPVACDILLTEATFGRPEFKFPATARVTKMIHAFIEAARATKNTPVLTGYALGKAQELVALLAGFHETVWVHPKIAAFCEIYRRAGIKLPEYKIPTAGAPAGALVVMPPNFARTEWREKVVRPRVCFCSGWALDRRAGGWYSCDQAIPLSDHADCESLVQFAHATGAAAIYTLHGFASEFADLLRGQGKNALSAPAEFDDARSTDSVEFSTETLDLFSP